MMADYNLVSRQRQEGLRLSLQFWYPLSRGPGARPWLAGRIGGSQISDERSLFFRRERRERKVKGDKGIRPKEVLFDTPQQTSYIDIDNKHPVTKKSID
jgi:hypothetical protein